jgi:hypothetical protein
MQNDINSRGNTQWFNFKCKLPKGTFTFNIINYVIFKLFRQKMTHYIIMEWKWALIQVITDLGVKIAKIFHIIVQIFLDKILINSTTLLVFNIQINMIQIH